MSKPMKFCRDCKHFRLNTSFHSRHYRHSEAICAMSPSAFNLVTGEVDDEDSGSKCRFMRESGKCGQSGSLFEPKPSLWQRIFGGGK